MGRPKALKPILIGCACLVPIGLVVGLSVNWNHTTFISATGSSGARGIVNGFGQKYHQENPNFEVNAESGGTATGLKDVYSGLCDIGNSTANPYEFVHSPDILSGNWENMKTFTLGWEGIALIYKMPDGLTTPNVQDIFDITIDEKNIDYLLADFSAFNELNDGSEWDESKVCYYNFLTKNAKENLNSHDLEICATTPIVPYVRSGGDRSAGASIAFSKMSHLNPQKLTKQQWNAFAGGQYGNDRKYYETDESNAQAWSMFEYNDIPGQMVYMTASFFNENNLKLIKEKGYKIAKYNNHEFNKDDVCNGYNWFRPINCSINVTNEKAVQFITWIYDQEFYESTLANYCITPLNSEQIESMDIDNLTTDIDLDAVRGSHVYGAEE